MLAHQLRSAECPAVALALIEFELVGQEPVAVAAIGVMREPAVFEDRQPEIGIFDDGVARPAADVLDRGAANEAHRAVHDDAVELVSLHHADVEEAGIFRVHGGVQRRAIAVAMILRRLHEADAPVGE